MNLTYTQEPWAHQRQVIEACARPHVTHHALFWEVGTGKTATVINILRAKELFGKRVLIFCPLSVASNWVREIRKHAPEVPVKEILDLAPMSGARREKEMLKLAGPWGNLEKPKILIVNYDALSRDSFYAMLKEWSPEVLVCDESQRIKNPKALRTKRIIELSTKCLNRYLLSGTPVLNSPMDIFSQFLVLDQGVSFGKNFFTFRAKYFEDKNATMAGMSHYFPKWVPRAGSLEEFNQKIARHSSRVIKSECLDLPELVKKRHFVELSPEQKRMYKEIKEEFLTWFKTQDDVNVPVVANIALTKLLRLQQVLSGFVKDAEGNTHRIAKNPRLEALRDLLEVLTPDHKVIVWAIFKEN